MTTSANIDWSSVKSVMEVCTAEASDPLSGTAWFKGATADAAGTACTARYRY